VLLVAPFLCGDLVDSLTTPEVVESTAIPEMLSSSRPRCKGCILEFAIQLSGVTQLSDMLGVADETFPSLMPREVTFSSSAIELYKCPEATGIPGLADDRDKLSTALGTPLSLELGDLFLLVIGGEPFAGRPLPGMLPLGNRAAGFASSA
jgi:hypothetical protein